VSSLDPVEISPQILELMKTESRFCPHFHVSLQSPHSKILKLMKRKYSAVEVEKCLQAISEIPGAFVGMDVITGFPGETDEIFEESVAQLERLPWSRLHVFPYSERGGTPATRLPLSVPKELRTARTRKLQALSLARLRSIAEAFLNEQQATQSPVSGVLLERHSKGEWVSGYTPQYLRFFMRAETIPEHLFNTTITVMPRELMIDESAGEVGFFADWVKG
jgi:tRNA A37 methylthiotransferase MiaB